MTSKIKAKLHVDSFGNLYWYNQTEQFHRDEEDLPAIIYANGDKAWYRNGKYYRENSKPTFEYKNGTQDWTDGNGCCIRRDFRTCY